MNRKKLKICFLIFVTVTIVVSSCVGVLVSQLLSRASSQEKTIKSNSSVTATSTSNSTSTSTSTSTSSSSFPTQGAIFWHSQPISPNESVVVTGGGWNNSTDTLAVLVASLPNYAPGSPLNQADPNTRASSSDLTWIQATVLSQTYYSVTFILPPQLAAGAFFYRVTISETLTTSTPVQIGNVTLLNAPDLWFAQGDLANSASPGGWIGVYGTSIMLKAITPPNTYFSPSLALVTNDSSNTVYYLQVSTVKTLGNRWAQYFDVPSTVPVGTYYMYMHNGYGGPDGWTQYIAYDATGVENTIQIRVQTWNSTVYDISQMSGSTDDAQFASAVSLINKGKSGGIIYFPEGTYYLTKYVNVPDRTIIRGAGSSLTVLNWTVNTNNGFSNCLYGGIYSVENITLINSAYYGAAVLTFNPDSSGKDFSWVRNVNILSPPLNLSNSNFPGIINVYGPYHAIEDVYIQDSFNGLRMGNTAGGASYSRAVNVTLNFRYQSFVIDQGWNFVVEGCNRILLGNAITNNYSNGTQPGVLIADYDNHKFTRDVYYGNNTSTSEYGVWNDNTVGDSKVGLYFGPVALDTGTTNITLMNMLNFTLVESLLDTSSLNGTTMSVVQGTGTGQYRYIYYLQENTYYAIIDRPFTISLDSTSIVTITYFRGRELLVNNDFQSEGIHMAGWLAQAEVIYADNKVGGNFSDYTGILGFSGVSSTWRSTTFYWTAGGRFGCHMVGWYHQGLDNEIGGMTGVNMYFEWEVPDIPIPWYKGQYPMGIIFRNNYNSFDRTFNISFPTYAGSFVIENNTQVGTISGNATGCDGVVRGNTPGNGTTNIPITVKSANAGQVKFY